MLNPDELLEIEKRCAAATPGPWSLETDRYGDEIWLGGSNWYTRTIDPIRAYLGGDGEFGISKQNAEFIAASRTDIPLLIESLKEAQAELKKKDEFARLYQIEMETKKSIPTPGRIYYVTAEDILYFLKRYFEIGDEDA